MIRMSKIALGMFGLVIAAMAGVGCNNKPKGPLNVPLTYRPTDIQHIGLSDVEATVFVAPAVDQRDRKDAIGENREKAEIVPVLTGDEPAAFVQKIVTDQLRAAGVTVNDTAAGSDRTVTVTVLKFWCEESPNYRAEVRCNVAVADASGKQLWKGVVVGQNSRFGRSLSSENYQECLSDATLNMISRLLSTPGFTQALKK